MNFPTSVLSHLRPKGAAAAKCPVGASGSEGQGMAFLWVVRLVLSSIQQIPVEPFAVSEVMSL